MSPASLVFWMYGLASMSFVMLSPLNLSLQNQLKALVCSEQIHWTNTLNKYIEQMHLTNTLNKWIKSSLRLDLVSDGGPSSAASNHCYLRMKRNQKRQMCGIEKPHLNCRQAAIICWQFWPSGCHQEYPECHNFLAILPLLTQHARVGKQTWPQCDRLGKGCEKCIEEVHTWVFTHGGPRACKNVLGIFDPGEP